MQWPTHVYILDPSFGESTLFLSGEDGSQYPTLSALRQFRDAELKSVITDNTPSELQLMKNIWQYRFDCLHTIQARYPATFSMYDLYNAAWSACGYENNQSDKVYKLATMRFESAYTDHVITGAN